MTTIAEENYLKAIYKITEKDKQAVQTTQLAKVTGTSAASVTDMVKKLSIKGYLHYEKYYGATLTARGIKITTALIRRQRLWKVFLTQSLRFDWDKINDIADDLEHIKSPELISRLDAFLNFPKFDTHGEPIPNKEGRFTLRNQLPLSHTLKNEMVEIVGLRDSSDPFLQYLNKLNLKLGSKIKIVEHYLFDHSTKIKIIGFDEAILSEKVCQNILIKKV